MFGRENIFHSTQKIFVVFWSYSRENSHKFTIGINLFIIFHQKDPNNSPAWEIPEREQRPPSTKLPLFVKAQSVHKSHHQTEVNYLEKKTSIKINFRIFIQIC